MTSEENEKPVINEDDILDYNVYESEKFYEILAKTAPFLCLVSGRIRQGKSVNVLGLYIYLKKHKIFDQEVVVSGSIHKGVWSRNGASKKAQFEKLTTEQMKAVIEYQKKKGKKNRLLLILDDVLASTDTRNKEFVGLISILRHLNISIVVVSQKIRAIDPIIRSNADVVVLHKQAGQANLNTIYEEVLTADIKRRDFYDYFNEATDDYQAIVVDNTSTQHQDKFFIVKCDVKKHGIKE